MIICKKSGKLRTQQTIISLNNLYDAFFSLSLYVCIEIPNDLKYKKESDLVK